MNSVPLSEDKTAARIAILESLLEAETARAEGWIKQYNKLKADFDLTVAITGNKYEFKSKDYIPEPDGFSIEDMRAAFYAGKDHTADEYRDGQSIGFDEWISTRKPS